MTRMGYILSFWFCPSSIIEIICFKFKTTIHYYSLCKEQKKVTALVWDSLVVF